MVKFGIDEPVVLLNKLWSWVFINSTMEGFESAEVTVLDHKLRKTAEKPTNSLDQNERPRRCDNAGIRPTMFLSGKSLWRCSSSLCAPHVVWRQNVPNKWQQGKKSRLKKGREVNFGFFFVFFFGIFFVFWVSHVFSFFFWYFPFILLDFPVNSDAFFTFVLFFLAAPCVSFFFCFVVLFLEEVWRWEESSLNIKKLEGGWGGVFPVFTLLGNP